MSEHELDRMISEAKHPSSSLPSLGRPKTWEEFDPTELLAQQGKTTKYSKSNLGFAAALVALYVCTAILWYYWVREIVIIPDFIAFLIPNICCWILIGMRIMELDWETTPDYEQTNDLVQLISIPLTTGIVTDLIFDVNIIASLLGAPDLLAALVYSMTIVFIIIALNSGVYLYTLNQRSKVEVAKRVKNFRGTVYSKDIRTRKLNKSEVLGRSIAVVILVSAIMFIIYMWSEYFKVMAEFADRPLSERESFSKILWFGLYGSKSSGMVSAQYGGGDAFGGLFEMVFFNQVSAMLLFLMFLGTFTSIFVVNMVKAQGLQNIATIVAVGLPMLVIISVMIGLVDPPSIFVDIMNNRAIASFMFTFVEMCVYIIYMAIFFTFNNIAEVFQPGDDIGPQ